MSQGTKPLDGRRKEFFAVYEKTSETPLFVSNKYEEASKYCDDNNLSEETHMLCKHTKKTGEVELGFFCSPRFGDQPIGMQIKDLDKPDDSHIAVVMAQSKMRAQPRERKENE